MVGPSSRVVALSEEREGSVKLSSTTHPVREERSGFVELLRRIRAVR